MAMPIRAVTGTGETPTGRSGRRAVGRAPGAGCRRGRRADRGGRDRRRGGAAPRRRRPRRWSRGGAGSDRGARAGRGAREARGCRPDPDVAGRDRAARRSGGHGHRPARPAGGAPRGRRRSGRHRPTSPLRSRRQRSLRPRRVARRRRHTTARIRSTSIPTGSRGSDPNACDRPPAALERLFAIVTSLRARGRAAAAGRRGGGRRPPRPGRPRPSVRHRPRPTAPRSPRPSACRATRRRRSRAASAACSTSRAALRICSGASCPAAIRADCVDWLDQVAHSLPSVVVTARARGADILAVKVFIDGKLATETADRLRAGGRSRAAQVPLRVAALAGDRARGAGQRRRQGPAHRRRVRAAAADRRAAGGAPEPPKPFRLERSDYVFGGIALAGFATLAYFGGTGIYDAHQLERPLHVVLRERRRERGARRS